MCCNDFSYYTDLQFATADFQLPTANHGLFNAPQKARVAYKLRL